MTVVLYRTLLCMYMGCMMVSRCRYVYVYMYVLGVCEREHERERQRMCNVSVCVQHVCE